MTDYVYKNDGKIHTRYSDLLRCTPKSVNKLLDEMQKLSKRFSNASMSWGTDRHAMWEEEARKTGKLPKVFELDWDADYIEAEFASELLPGMIVHSRPDVVCAKEMAVVDYKTMVAKSLHHGKRKAYVAYRSARQLKFYAFQLGMHGITIRKAVYLVEIWNEDQTDILGYQNVVCDLDLKTISSVLPWARERLLCLAEAVAAREAAI